MNSKLANALGMASGAGKLIFGEKLLDYIKQNKVTLVLISIDMGPAQKKKFNDKCNFYEVEHYDDLFVSDELNDAIGKTNVKAVGFADINIVKLLKESL